jgi:hypothetical protein
LHFGVRFKAFEKVSDTIEEIGKDFFTRVDILGSLAASRLKILLKRY